MPHLPTCIHTQNAFSLGRDLQARADDYADEENPEATAGSENPEELGVQSPGTFVPGCRSLASCPSQGVSTHDPKWGAGVPPRSSLHVPLASPQSVPGEKVGCRRGGHRAGAGQQISQQPVDGPLRGPRLCRSQASLGSDHLGKPKRKLSPAITEKCLSICARGVASVAPKCPPRTRPTGSVVGVWLLCAWPHGHKHDG